jgi:hypothetical protein
MSGAMLPRSQLTSCSCLNVFGWVPVFIKLLCAWPSYWTLRCQLCAAQCLDAKENMWQLMLWLGWSGILALAAQVLGVAVWPRKGGPPTSSQMKNVSATWLLLCAWLCSPTLLLRTWLISLTNPIFHQAALAVCLAKFQTFNVLVWNFAALLRVIKCLAVMCDKMWDVSQSFWTTWHNTM